MTENQAEQQAFSQIRRDIEAGNDLESIRAAGWGDWIDHFEAKGIDLTTGEFSTSLELRERPTEEHVISYLDDDDRWSDRTRSPNPILHAGRRFIYGAGAFIVGAFTCITGLIGLAVFVAVLVSILGVWGGIFWAILWFMFGLPLSFGLVGLITFPIRLFGGLLMYLGSDE